jgi:MFS family permease
MTELAPSEKRRGKRNYSIFQGINTFSFVILSGDFIILYLLKLGAENSLVGVVTSFKYLSFLFMFVGRMLIPHMGIRRLMGTFWAARYVLIIPALFSPILLAAGYPREAILLTVLAVLGSNIARGVGIVGFKPVLGAITDERERGAFISQLEIITYVCQITIGIITAFFIGKSAPLFRYVIFLGLGVAMGLGSALIVFRFPDPPEQKYLIGTGFLEGIKRAMKRKNFGFFVFILFITSFSIGFVPPFMVVYAKRVYLQSDGLILFLTVAGSAGAVGMGFLTRLVIDRLGAKPMYILFNLLFTLSIVPMIISPRFPPGMLVIFLAILFFFLQMGFSGSQNASQNYFFAVVESSEHLNLGILFNVVSGIGSAVGALSGGVLLDLLGQSRGSELASFRAYWTIALVFSVLSISLMTGLKKVGPYSVRDALSIIFSPRDIKAVSILNRLEHSSTPAEELKFIKALRASPSRIALEDLLAMLKNPRFYIRSQALRTIENIPYDRRLEHTLRAEIKNHEYTTAYMAARILGKKDSPANRRTLRRALKSDDYLLQANAALALGHLKDLSARTELEHLVAESKNALVVIHAARALEMLQHSSSLFSLLAALKQKDPPPFLRDELILSAAGILGIGDWFYPFYKVFLKKAGSGFMHLEDYMSSARTQHPKDYKELRSLLLPILSTKRGDFSTRAKRILKTLGERNAIPPEVLQILLKVVTDSELMRFERLAFLIAAYLVKTTVASVG